MSAADRFNLGDRFIDFSTGRTGEIIWTSQFEDKAGVVWDDTGVARESYSIKNLLPYMGTPAPESYSPPAAEVADYSGSGIRFSIVYSDDLAFVTARTDRTPAIGQGAAIRNPSDTPNRQIGVHLAEARALIDLGYKLEEIALESAGVKF